MLLLAGFPEATLAQGKGVLSQVLEGRSTLSRSQQTQILGKFDGLDLGGLGQIWRSGRDPRTCVQAQFYSDLYQRAPAELKDRLAQAMKAGWVSIAAYVTPFEEAVVDALEFDGRTDEAEVFLRDRIAHQVDAGRLTARDSDRSERDAEARRVRVLRLRLAMLQALTRPDQGERELQALVATLVKGRQASYAEKAWAFRPIVLDMSVADAQELLAPFYALAGRPAEALALYERSLDLFKRDRDSQQYARPNDGDPTIAIWTSKVAFARAEVAAADPAHLAEAEKLYRAYALGNDKRPGEAASDGLPALIRILLLRGKRDEAALLALRLALSVGQDLVTNPGQFACMKWPSGGPLDADIRHAQMMARGTAPLASIRDKRGMVGDFGERSSDILDADGNFPLGPTAKLPSVGQMLDRATEAGELLLDSGLADDARAVLEPTLGLQRLIFGDNHPSALRALIALSWAERQRGQLQRAAELGASWRAGSESFLRQRLWNVSEQARRNFFRDDRKNVERVLDVMVAAERPDAAMQVFALSVGRKGLLTRVASRIDALARGRADPATRALVQQVQQRRQQLAAWSLRDEDGLPEARIARRALDDLEVQLAAAVRPGRVPELDDVPARVLKALQPDEALVDFLVYRDPDPPRGERMLAVVARGTGRLALVSWPDLSALRDSGLRLRRAMLQDDQVEVESAAAALAQAWWWPLEQHLQGVRRIDLASDGLLNILPLSALKDRSGSLLIAAHDLRQLTSARDLLDTPTVARHATAWLFGAPDYGIGASAGWRGEPSRTGGRDLADLHFTPLPGALHEVQQVAAIVKPVFAQQVFTGAAASKGALLRARAPTLLHLATHGFFLDDSTRPETAGGDPLQALARSGLALANANAGLAGPASGVGVGNGNGNGNGILTALEAVSLDLRGTRLVTLSACDTALGQTASADGIYGLIRAFHEAGAQSVLGTLWSVSDEATSTFMQSFYRRVVAGEAASTALQRTQMEFAQDARWSHPRHWAGFIVTGKD